MIAYLFNYVIKIIYYSTVPIFIQVHPKSRNMFVGICEGSTLKTHFQIVHFHYIPSQYGHLSGLLELFKSKLVSNDFNKT